MKRFSILLIFMTILVVNMNAQRTYALLTGVSNYGDEQLNLHNTTKDVKQLKTVMDKLGVVCGVSTSKNVTQANITKRLNTIIEAAKPEDRIIFYFSGHGTTGGFLMSDQQLFNYSDLIKILSKAKTKNIFCFIDACRSGSVATDSYAMSDSDKARITFVMSSRPDELSIENDWIGNGYFTQAMLKGLRGMSDKNHDKRITLIELFKYIYNDVTVRTKNGQHPQLIGPGSAQNTVIANWK